MKKQLLILAWRNIWRNKRRALLTISSIVVSLFFVLFMRQMQFWSYNFNIKNSVSGSIGYLQITDSSYIDEKIVDNSMLSEQVPVVAITAIEGVSGLHPRFQSGALVSTGIKSKFAAVLGISPSQDMELLKLPNKLRKGKLLEPNDKAVLITEKMAEYYKVSVGDSLIFMGQGYQGYTAAGIYPIKGIVYFPAGDLSNSVFMSLRETQKFYVAPDRFTNYLINIENSKDLHKINKQVQQLLIGSALTVRTWEEVLPGLKQGFEIDANSGLIISGILYMIVGFGIFGTIVMLYNERRFEFGVLTAIGMNKSDLLLITITELSILTLIGVFFGNLLSFPLLYYLNNNPIELGGEAANAMMEQGFDPYMGTGLYIDVFAMNSLAVILIAAITSGYMILKIANLNALSAMKQ